MDNTSRRKRGSIPDTPDINDNQLTYSDNSRPSGQPWTASKTEVDDADTLAENLLRTNIGKRPLTYSMDLAIDAPARVAAGVALDIPIVVTFRASLAVDKFGSRDAGVAMTDSSLSGYWVFLSLVTEDRTRSVAPPESNLLNGQTTDSIHKLVNLIEEEEKPFAYAKFPGLSVAAPGRYCFQISMVDMNRPDHVDASFAVVLPVLHSRVFEVVENQDEHENDTERTRAVTQLRTYGVDI